MLGPFVASIEPRNMRAANIIVNDCAAPAQNIAIDHGMNPSAISHTRFQRSANQPNGSTDSAATTP